MMMARQRDRVDVNRAVGEHIGIGSNWKVCYRFGAGQNTRTPIGDGGGVSGGGSYRESRGRARVLARAARPMAATSGRCVCRSGAGLVVVGIRSVAEPCGRLWQTRSDRAPYGHWLSKPFLHYYHSRTGSGDREKKNLICKDE